MFFGAGGLRQLFQRSVAMQEALEVKAGLFLSAGLDSNALLAMQSRSYGANPLTLTVGFEKPAEMADRLECDELQDAARTAEPGCQREPVPVGRTGFRAGDQKNGRFRFSRLPARQYFGQIR